MAKRVLIVGWDGADWEILDPLLEAGELPNLAALIARGRRGVSRSCLPSHSWAAWPTFLTGRDPAGHGVFDILEYRPGATRRLPVSSRSILAPTWPQRLSDAGRTSLVVNVPLTYPAPEIKRRRHRRRRDPAGRHLQPPAPTPARDLGWPINGGSWTTFRHRPLDLIADVEGVTRRRAEAMRRLLDEQPWDAACMVFVSPDRIQHCLLEYVHPGHPDFPAASPDAGGRRACATSTACSTASWARCSSAPAPDDLVLLMSDHGHQPVTRALNMNRVLERLGVLRMGRGSALVSLLAWGRIRSIARVAYDRLGPARQGRRPHHPDRLGAHDAPTPASPRPARASRSRWPAASRRARLPRRTTSACATSWPARCSDSSTRPPAATRSRRCYARRTCWTAPYLDRAPDLLLEPAPLYSLTHARQAVEQADWLSGDHRPEGVYVAAGPGVVGRGRARRSRWPTSPAGSPARWAWSRPAERPDPGRRHRPVGVFSDDEEREVEERLRGLGYLE